MIDALTGTCVVVPISSLRAALGRTSHSEALTSVRIYIYAIRGGRIAVIGHDHLKTGTLASRVIPTLVWMAGRFVFADTVVDDRVIYPEFANTRQGDRIKDIDCLTLTQTRIHILCVREVAGDSYTSTLAGRVIPILFWVAFGDVLADAVFRNRVIHPGVTTRGKCSGGWVQ